ncbi:MAG TPA: Rieske 2Fe-2S domain-containing protein [Dehalococcoidia bacterium]|nr:Rieske 2Fe-2S domain-containing protein [Dehalococcoidia bacterium]
MVAAGAGGHPVVVAPAPLTGPRLPAVSRRKVLIIGFWTGIGAMLLSIVATILNSLYPRHVAKLTGTHKTAWTVDTLKPGDKQAVLIQVPDPNDPLNALEAKVYLVRVDAEQAARNPGAKAGMMYAFWRKCPHLGCTVPYSPTFSFTDPRTDKTYAGWFRCPCHGSTYSDTGVKVFGPAPRSLDMFPLIVGKDGSLSVNVGTVLTGGAPLSDVDSSRGVLPA